jgi:hypothetical protein
VGLATLSLLQRLHGVPSLTPRLRTLLATAGNAPGVPRGALRVAHQRLDDAERGLAPPVPTLETHPAFQPPSGPPPPQPQPQQQRAAAAQQRSLVYAPPAGGLSPERPPPAGHSMGARLPLPPTHAGAHAGAPPFCSQPAAAQSLPPPSQPQRSQPQRSPPRTLRFAPTDDFEAPPAAVRGGGGRKSLHGPDVEAPIEPVRVSADPNPRPSPSPSPSPNQVRVSGDALAREVKEAARTLRLPLRADGGIWEQRAGAMRRVHALLLGGAARHAQCAHLFNSLLKEPLGLQLTDLRSKCVKQACALICEAAWLP